MTAFALEIQRSGLDAVLVDVVLEVAFFYSPVWEDHTAETMLYAVLPLSFVHASISPQHLTVTMPLVFFKVTLVDVARGPSEHSFAMFLLILIVSFVDIAGLAFPTLAPLALALLNSLEEVTNIDGSIGPGILASAMWFAV